MLMVADTKAVIFQPDGKVDNNDVLLSNADRSDDLLKAVLLLLLQF
jgi:hypothetical protein